MTRNISSNHKMRFNHVPVLSLPLTVCTIKIQESVCLFTCSFLVLSFRIVFYRVLVYMWRLCFYACWFVCVVHDCCVVCCVVFWCVFFIAWLTLLLSYPARLPGWPWHILCSIQFNSIQFKAFIIHKTLHKMEIVCCCSIPQLNTLRVTGIDIIYIYIYTYI